MPHSCRGFLVGAPARSRESTFPVCLPTFFSTNPISHSTLSFNLEAARDYYNYSPDTVTLLEEDRSETPLSFDHARQFFAQDAMRRGMLLEKARDLQAK